MGDGCFDRMSVRGPSLVQAQVDRYSERFLGREESRIRPEDLEVIYLKIVKTRPFSQKQFPSQIQR